MAEQVRVQIVKQPGASRAAEVVAGGRTYRLPGVMAASGVRYFDGRGRVQKAE